MGLGQADKKPERFTRSLDSSSQREKRLRNVLGQVEKVREPGEQET